MNDAFPVTTAPSEIAGPKMERKGVLFYNNGTDKVFISQDQANVSTKGMVLPPGASIGFLLRDGDNTDEAYYAAANSGTQDVRIYEGVPSETNIKRGGT